MNAVVTLYVKCASCGIFGEIPRKDWPDLLPQGWREVYDDKSSTYMLASSRECMLKIIGAN